jgi:TetR/AcrR family transcriptional regulator, transcriptional repressor for nem operon
MARNKEFDPDVVLERALEVFWTRGYEATSISDLVAELRIGRASLYSTYGSKHELYLRALDRYVQMRDPAVLDQLSQPGPVLPAVRSLIESYVRDAADTDHRGCLVVNAAIERLPGDAQVARHVLASWHTLEVALCSALTRARAQGELQPAADPRELARFLLVMLQGLRVLGKAEADRGVLEAAARQALKVLTDN